MGILLERCFLKLASSLGVDEINAYFCQYHAYDVNKDHLPQVIFQSTHSIRHLSNNYVWNLIYPGTFLDIFCPELYFFFA